MLLRDERVQVSTSTEPEILNEFPDTFWLVNSPLKAAIFTMNDIMVSKLLGAGANVMLPAGGFIDSNGAWNTFFIWEFLILRLLHLYNKITEAQSKRAKKIADLLARAGAPRKHTVGYLQEQWISLRLPERKKPAPRLVRAFEAITRLHNFPITLSVDEQLRIEYHNVNRRKNALTSTLGLSRKALHEGSITRGRMNFYLYNNINLIAELLVVLPRVPLKIPSQQAIMMISRELGAKAKLSGRQEKIGERKRPREAENEPMKEELTATGAVSYTHLTLPTILLV